jgi:hypothetical protein
MNFAATAPALHQAGLNVLPVDHETKRPLIPWSRWQKNRQSAADLDRLRRTHPDAAAAVVLGGPALVLADVETDSAAGETALRKAGLPLPPTAAFSSPRGNHRLYRSADRLPRRVGALPEVDLLGSGYVIVPPSPGRSWALDLSHLQDLPAEWASVAYHHQRRRGDGIPEPPLTLPLDPQSLQLQQVMHIQDLLQLTFDLGLLEDVAKLLGVPSGVGRAFRCPLPGHSEHRASAAWWTGKNRTVVLMDFHRRPADDGTAPPCYTLVEVYASLRSGRTRKLRPPEHAVWARRLALELGLAAPAAVSLPPLPSTASPSVRIVYSGIKHLFEVRWLREPGAPAPLSWRFLSSWCGVNQRTSAAALRDLLRRGILIRAGTWKRTALFLPANFESDRGAS